MAPGWQRLAGLAREVCALWFRFFSAVFASKGYPFKNMLYGLKYMSTRETSWLIINFPFKTAPF